MRVAIVAWMLALALPGAAAGAAPLGELPFDQRRGVAGCVEATGAPGGLSVLGPYSRRESATDLLTAGGGRTARVSLGRLAGCAAVAEAAGGAAIVAGAAVSRTGGDVRSDLRAAIREPGGAFGPPVRLGGGFGRPAVAIAPSGAAAVAWVAGSAEPDSKQRLVIARRAPGAAFGRPETVTTWRSFDFPAADVQAAIDASGTVTVLLSRAVATEPGGTRIEVATAPPGAGFAKQRLAADGDAAPVLAVAPDGWALVAHEDEPPALFERAPGATTFSPVAVQASQYEDPTVAVRSGGGALVAWGTGSGGVDALTRETAGPFTARRIAGPRPIRDLGIGELSVGAIDPFAGPPIGFDRARLQAAVAPDGRAVLAWPSPAGRRPLAAKTARAAVGRLDGAFEPARTLGSPMRDADDLAAVFTADGRAAVAWTDNTSRASRGRLHVALEGAAATRRPAPGLRLTLEPGQRLYPSERVRARVRCSAVCDLRMIVIGPRGTGDARSLTRRGSHVIGVGPAIGLRPGTRRRVRVVVHATAPGGQETAARSLRVPVIGLRSLPLRAPRGVRARRDSDAIGVTWRTDAPARRQTFIVIGEPRRAGPFDPFAYALEDGGGRTRFRVRLRPADPNRITRVTVFVESYDSGEDGPGSTVRVR